MNVTAELEEVADQDAIATANDYWASMAQTLPTVDAAPEGASPLFGQPSRPDLLSLLGAHPIAEYARSAADAIQLPRDTAVLIGLGLTSGVVSTAYRTETHYGKMLPVGLYVLAEQPSGVGKSGLMDYFQKPFFSALHSRTKGIKDARKSIENNIDAESNKDEADEQKIEQLRSNLASIGTPIKGWYTNPTPEALEQKALAENDGLFMLASDEQGLINSLFGLSYGKGAAPNMDAALKGFDGGFYNSIRVTRDGYCGEAHGSIVIFAQQGASEKILTASGGTGVAERFLMIAPDHLLGTRNHKRKYVAPDRAPYEKLCESVVTRIPAETTIERLNNVALPAALSMKIADMQQELEPELADGGRFDSDALRGAASKLNLQILKIAAVLHVSRYLCDGVEPPANIGAADFDVAASLARELLERYRAMLIEKRIIGVLPECEAIISYIESNTKNGELLDYRRVREGCRKRKEFLGRKVGAVDAAIEKLIELRMVHKQHNPVTRREMIGLLSR